MLKVQMMIDDGKVMGKIDHLEVPKLFFSFTIYSKMDSMILASTKHTFYPSIIIAYYFLFIDFMRVSEEMPRPALL